MDTNPTVTISTIRNITNKLNHNIFKHTMVKSMLTTVMVVKEYQEAVGIKISQKLDYLMDVILN